MSICRFTEDSDVYMYYSDGGIDCCGCLLHPKPADPEFWYFKTAREAADHLLAHREAGHLVPQYAIDELIERIAEDD